jgi:Cu-Zn family superoxide dismutase
MSAPSSHELPGEAVFPEGIAVQTATGELFVSSFTSGAIFRGSLERPGMEVFLPGGVDGRTSALGLAVDQRDRLLVCGGTSGLVFVYDLARRTLLRRFDNGLPKTTDPREPKAFINDVTITPVGDAFLTDSIVPVLYRIPAYALEEGGVGDAMLEPWLAFEGTALRYTYGGDLVSSLNLNGIVSSADGRFLLVVQTNTGKVFRIEVATRQVDEVKGVVIPGGDGLVLDGQVLYGIHVDPAPIMRFRLSPDLLRGEAEPLHRQPALKAPTTGVMVDGRLLVVNSQFDKLFYGGQPEQPFTVSNIAVDGL